MIFSLASFIANGSDIILGENGQILAFDRNDSQFLVVSGPIYTEVQGSYITIC